MFDFKKILTSPRAVLTAGLLSLTPACTTMPPAPGYGSGYGAQRQNGYSQTGGFGNPAMPNPGVSVYAQQRAEYNSLTKARSRARKVGDYNTEAQIMYRQEVLREEMKQSRYLTSQQSRTQRAVIGAPASIVEGAVRTGTSALKSEVNGFIRGAIRGY